MIIGFIVTLIVLIFVAAVEVPVGSLGRFERSRRMEEGLNDDHEVNRELYYGDALSLQQVLRACLVVIMSLFAVSSFGWAVGTFVAIIVALEYGSIARIGLLRGTATRYYYRFEPKLLMLFKRYTRQFSYIRNLTPHEQDVILHSRAELAHLVESSTTILNDNEKKLIVNGLGFSDKVVRDIMTPRSVIETIDRNELLGPLVLDDLHKKGHNRFPVVDGDVDHVVGILHLRDVLAVDTMRKHTSKVESAMDTRTLYIHEYQSLSHALDAFLKTHHHLFIVVNEYRETVGLLTLEDVIEALLGRKISDEFDAHDDLRAVAARNPRGNNSTKDARDV